MGFQTEAGVLKKYTEENGIYDIVIPDGVKVFWNDRKHSFFLNIYSF